MKKETFEILDAGFKKDVKANYRKARKKIDDKYAKKSYPKEFQEKGKKADNIKRRKEKREELKKIIDAGDKFHFKESNGINRSEAKKRAKNDGKAKKSFNKTSKKGVAKTAFNKQANATISTDSQNTSKKGSSQGKDIVAPNTDKPLKKKFDKLPQKAKPQKVEKKKLSKKQNLNSFEKAKPKQIPKPVKKKTPVKSMPKMKSVERSKSATQPKKITKSFNRSSKSPSL